MNTISISIERIIENVYAYSALLTAGGREKPALLSADDAAAMRRVVINIASGGLLKLCSCVEAVKLPENEQDDQITFSIREHLSITGYRGAFEAWLTDAVVASVYGNTIPEPPVLRPRFTGGYIHRA